MNNFHSLAHGLKGGTQITIREGDKERNVNDMESDDCWLSLEIESCDNKC